MCAKSKMICRKAYDALALKDKQTMWNVLQEYLHKYSQLFTIAKGVQLKRVDVYFYEKITEDDVDKQLKIVIGLMYLNEAKHCAGKER